VQQTRIAKDGLAEAAEMSGRPLRSTTVDFILPGLAFFFSGLHYCLLENVLIFFPVLVLL
jgi:hypothetical protein